MKFFTTIIAVALATAATVAIAKPVILDHDLMVSKMTTRQAAVNTTSNDFIDTGCKDVMLFFARGSTQSGNIGEMPGPDLIAQLKTALGSTPLAAQGIDYAALLETNFIPGGCAPSEAAAMAKEIANATITCPNAKLVVAGYSQGAAMVHRSVSVLSDAVKARIFAAVTFGDTQKQQDGGRIPNFDTAKTLILCNDGDLVCNGTLIVTDAHTNYLPKVPTAVTFIAGKVA